MADPSTSAQEQGIALRLLESDEHVQRITRSQDATGLVTDRRIAIARGDRVAMDIPYERLRRIQFDVERRRPATLVLVPELPRDEPQVLAVEPERYEEVADALVIIGRRLAALD